ncbi:MAG: GNAT family N-acetyltransferase [Bacillota bacterium]
MIELKPINWSNFWDVVALKPKHEQTKYIQPISVFMAESYVNLREKNPDISMAIYFNSQLIGFFKIVYIPKFEESYNLTENSYMIDALIIDESFQGKGYGKLALKKVIDFILDFPFGKAKTISLVCYKQNQKAINLFHKFNFIKTKPKNKNMYIYLKKI